MISNLEYHRYEPPSCGIGWFGLRVYFVRITELSLNWWPYNGPAPLGRLVWSPFSAKPGLKVYRSINFSCTKVFLFLIQSLCSVKLFKLKTEGQTISTENRTEKLQNSNQNSCLSWFNFIGLWTTQSWSLLISDSDNTNTGHAMWIVYRGCIGQSSNIDVFRLIT